MLMTEPFDLVLLDLFLGETDGASVANFATHLNPSCKVVVVTGTSLYPNGELFAMAPSVWAVMRKPVDIEDIMALCEHIAADGAMPPPRPLRLQIRKCCACTIAPAAMLPCRNCI